MWIAFANAKATHIFSAKRISIYAIFNDQSFNDMLTNNIFSFKQLGPGLYVPYKTIFDMFLFLVLLDIDLNGMHLVFCTW